MSSPQAVALTSDQYHDDTVDRQGNVTEDDGGDITWEEDSPVDCGECAWSGTVKDLETDDEEEEETW